MKSPKIIDKTIIWTMYLPYKDIVQAENYLDVYLDYYFEAITIVFRDYAVEPHIISALKKITKLEVLNNPEYKYIEGFMTKIRKYDFD